MKIIIANCVERDLNKLLSKVEFFILLKKLKKTNVEGIYLKRPFVKIKISILKKVIRLIAEFKKEKWVLVLNLIFLKADKTFWENITWNKVEEKLLLQLTKIDNDLRNLNFKIY